MKEAKARQGVKVSDPDENPFETERYGFQLVCDRLLVIALMNPHRDINESLVTELLKWGANPNWCGPECEPFDGRSSLHHAAIYGHVNSMNALLQADANPFIPDKNGDSPLHVACR